MKRLEKDKRKLLNSTNLDAISLSIWIKLRLLLLLSFHLLFLRQNLVCYFNLQLINIGANEESEQSQQEGRKGQQNDMSSEKPRNNYHRLQFQ